MRLFALFACVLAASANILNLDGSNTIRFDLHQDDGDVIGHMDARVGPHGKLLLGFEAQNLEKVSAQLSDDKKMKSVFLYDEVSSGDSHTLDIDIMHVVADTPMYLSSYADVGGRKKDLGWVRDDSKKHSSIVSLTFVNPDLPPITQSSGCGIGTESCSIDSDCCWIRTCTAGNNDECCGLAIESCAGDSDCCGSRTCTAGISLDECCGLMNDFCSGDSDCCGSGTCSAGTCIECTTNSDCSGLDVCIAGVCDACTIDAHCSAPTDICFEGACVECIINSHCSGIDVCGIDGTCGACTNDGECDDPGDYCYINSGGCVPPCTSNLDCGADDNCSLGRCVTV